MEFDHVSNSYNSFVRRCTKRTDYNDQKRELTENIYKNKSKLKSRIIKCYILIAWNIFFKNRSYRLLQKIQAGGKRSLV